ESVIGTEFYIMERLEGRVFHDNSLPGIDAQNRTLMFESMAKTLARLHNLDPIEVGLADFGRHENFIQRQIERWTMQYQQAQFSVESLERLGEWLSGNIPEEQAYGVAHGDYRLGNLMFHPTEPRVLAILDWELSTLGPAPADLGYNLTSWFMKPDEYHGLSGLPLSTLGIPDHELFADFYYRERGLQGRFDPYYTAFAFFRMSAIFVGIVERASAAGKESSEQISFYRKLCDAFPRHGLKIIGEH
ncbi:MAG: phosphotransferase family protein, partial [Pseudomonadota bacterium]